MKVQEDASADQLNRVAFREHESVLHSHETPRWSKLKRADEHFANEGEVELEKKPAEDSGSSSPHVFFDAPEDILNPHDRPHDRRRLLKLADELYIPVAEPGSPHVGFIEPEKVLREHESSRLSSYKKGDERISRLPLTVQVAPYRVLFNTPEDLLSAHESPRLPCLKLADETYVRPAEDSEHESAVNFEPEDSSRFSIDEKTPIIQLWYANLIAGGLRTISTACPLAQVEREARVRSIQDLFHRVKGENGFVSLEQLTEVLSKHEDLRAVRQATLRLLQDVKEALEIAGRNDVLKQEDFTALLLTVVALFEQSEFMLFVRSLETKLLVVMLKRSLTQEPRSPAPHTSSSNCSNSGSPNRAVYQNSPPPTAQLARNNSGNSFSSSSFTRSTSNKGGGGNTSSCRKATQQDTAQQKSRQVEQDKVQQILQLSVIIVIIIMVRILVVM